MQRKSIQKVHAYYKILAMVLLFLLSFLGVYFLLFSLMTFQPGPSLHQVLHSQPYGARWYKAGFNVLNNSILSLILYCIRHPLLLSFLKKPCSIQQLHFHYWIAAMFDFGGQNDVITSNWCQIQNACGRITQKESLYTILGVLVWRLIIQHHVCDHLGLRRLA